MTEKSQVTLESDLSQHSMRQKIMKLHVGLHCLLSIIYYNLTTDGLKDAQISIDGTKVKIKLMDMVQYFRTSYYNSRMYSFLEYQHALKSLRIFME